MYGCSAPIKIGSVVPPYPEKYHYIGGACITDTCEFALEIISKGKGYPNIILFEKTAGRNENGKPKWVVINTLKLPYKENTFVNLGSCEHDGKEDNSIITLLPTKIDRSTEYLKAQHFAYKLDLASQQFVPLNVNYVRCYNTALDSD